VAIISKSQNCVFCYFADLQKVFNSQQLNGWINEWTFKLTTVVVKHSFLSHLSLRSESYAWLVPFPSWSMTSFIMPACLTYDLIDSNSPGLTWASKVALQTPLCFNSNSTSLLYLNRNTKKIATCTYIWKSTNPITKVT
jgi:hypothetical protein